MRTEERQLRAAIRARIASLVVEEEKCWEETPVCSGEAGERQSDVRELSDWRIEIRLHDNHPVRFRTTSAVEPQLSDVVHLLFSLPSLLTMVLSGPRKQTAL